LIDTERGIDLPRMERFDELCARVRCPVLVIHGDEDAIRPHAQGAALAAATGGTLVTLEGSGHLPHARDPVKVNLLLRDFAAPAPPAGRWARGRSRRKRALFISSPIGLGHARRDVAIAEELRRLPMPDGGEHEAFLTADYNAEMIEHIARYPRLRDRAIFVGESDDVVWDSFGAGLPRIRYWTEQHYDFAGYVTGFDPEEFGDRERLRAELSFGPSERVCVVTVGGSGVGESLLRRVIDAFPEAKRRVPELRMIVVAGPRIDAASLPNPDGLEVRAYVHDLYRVLAACDLAVVQGGLTTSMELTANGRPFLYFPLRHHFEQNFHVRHRLQRYGAGRAAQHLRGLLVHERSAGWPDRAQRTIAGTTSRKRS
jgi:Glycosyltransferase family 28 C-terminal domain